MNNLFLLLFFASIIALVVSLIKPALFIRFLKDRATRKGVATIFGITTVAFFILFSITTDTDTFSTERQSVQTTQSDQVTQGEVVDYEILEVEDQNPPPSKSPSQEIKNGTVLVTRIIDGDTIELEGGQRVRYIGIDTPETVDPRKPIQCFGIEASNYNKQLVEGKRVRLEKNVTDTDKYGRLLRYVYIGDTFVNLTLVQEGFAYSYTYPPDVKYQNQFIEAQRLAREQEKGLWGSCPVDPAPALAPAPLPTLSPAPSTACTIKGNISSSGEKIYHVEGCDSYNVTKIDEVRGERWFCAEEEAITAGWRKAKNCP